MENDLLKIGAAYIRVSDERQDKDNLSTQIKDVRDYAEEKGYTAIDENTYSQYEKMKEQAESEGFIILNKKEVK